MPIALLMHPILIGLGAGLASAALFGSAATGTPVGLFVLFPLSPMPVILAGLARGWISALVAITTAATMIAMLGNARLAVFYVAALGLPACAFSRFALLHRDLAPEEPAASGRTEWYPLGRIIAWALAWASLLTAIALISIAPDIDGLRSALGSAFDRMLVEQSREAGGDRQPGAGPLPQAQPHTTEAAPGPTFSEADKKAFIEVMVVTLPWALAAMWLTLAMLNAWAAAHVVRLSGQLARPWPDLAALALPRGTALAFAAAVPASFIPGMPGLIASGAASAVLFGYLLVGLAILHSITRGWNARPMTLGLVYGSLLLLSPISSLIVAMIGLAEPVSPWRRKPSAPA